MAEIPYFQYKLTGNELKYLTEVLESGWLTTGRMAQVFEKNFADYIGCKYALAVSSCTAALHLAVEALNISHQDCVFVPTMTFTATAEVLRYVGAQPILLDVDRNSRNITPAILQEAINNNPGTKYLMLVHFGGQAACLNDTDREGIISLCRRNGIKIIHDAAHALPSKHGGKLIGSFPDVSCFSFYANKTITTAEGGMLTTDDHEIYERVKLMRLHGIDRDSWDRFTSVKPKWEYDIVAAGFKYNLPDVLAAIGVAQLEQIDSLRAARQKVAQMYIDRLHGHSQIRLPNLINNEDHAWHIFQIELSTDTKLKKNKLITELSDVGIGCSVHYKPLHKMTYYKKICECPENNYSNANEIWDVSISLPIHPHLSEHDVEKICKVLIHKTKSRSYLAA